MTLVDTKDVFLRVLGGVALVTIAWRGFSLHLGVHPLVWTWGYREDWYDGPIPNIGLGPLFLFNWLYSFDEAWNWE